MREGSAGWTKMLGYLTEAQSTQRSSVRIREGKKVNLSVPCVFVVQGFFTAKARRTRRGFLLVLSISWRKDSGSGRNQALPGGYKEIIVRKGIADGLI